MSNDDYAIAWDTLAAAIGAAKGQSSGSIDDIDHLSLDQQFKVAEVAALLSIAQELSALNPQNTMKRDEDGNEVNGWGIVTRKAGRPPGQLNLG